MTIVCVPRAERYRSGSGPFFVLELRDVDIESYQECSASAGEVRALALQDRDDSAS